MSDPLWNNKVEKAASYSPSETPRKKKSSKRTRDLLVCSEGQESGSAFF